MYDQVYIVISVNVWIHLIGLKTFHESYQLMKNVATSRQRVKSSEQLIKTVTRPLLTSVYPNFLFLNQNICCGYSNEPSQ